MSPDDLEQRFFERIKAEQLLAPQDTVLAAVSGGPDSVAMLHLLCALHRRPGWSLRLHVAHLNHQLRGAESDADAAFVQNLAQQLRLLCTVESADMRKRAEAEHLSIEQAARRSRFEFFERLCLKLGCNAAALAHHADDNAETVLHRIIRGTGLRGLGGIRPQRPMRPGSAVRIIRPMLKFTRGQIEQYLRENGLACRRDSTNKADAYTRNRLRRQVLPLLRARFNPQVSEALNRLAEQARGLDAYLTETGQRILEALIIEHNDRQLVLHCPSLVRRPRVLQMQLIRQAILRMGLAERDLTFSHFSAVAELAGDSEGSKTLDLPGGLRVHRRYARLIFEWAAGQPSLPSTTNEIHLPTDGTVVLPFGQMEITADCFPADEAAITDYLRQRRDAPDQLAYEEWLDADGVQPPLLARPRRPGDRFFPLGMTVMKKVSDFLIDEKVEAHLRERMVVVCDRFGPIWIVPLRIDQRVRLTKATHRILRLRARPVEQ